MLFSVYHVIPWSCCFWRTRGLRHSVFLGIYLVVMVVQHKAHPYSTASVSHFCLHCLASLHQHPQSQPSITSLTNTHTANTYHWKPATSPWNGNMVRTSLFFFFFFSGKSPKFYSCCLSLASSYFPTPALCVRDYEEQIFQRGNERAC